MNSEATADAGVVQRFAILFNRFNRAMVLFGIIPSRCRLELDERQLRVRMGWAFRLEAPRAGIVSVTRRDRRVWAWGAHGWRGRWLVNGSSKGLVTITFVAPVRGYTFGAFPLKVKELTVSLTEPTAFVAALG